MTPSLTGRRIARWAIGLVPLALAACPDDTTQRDVAVDASADADAPTAPDTFEVMADTVADPGAIDDSANPDLTAADTDEPADTAPEDAAGETEAHADAGAETNEEAATDATLETDDGPVDEVDAGPTVCDPPLTITPGEAWLLPLGAVDLTGDGGTGAYRFALVEPASNALLNPLTGYLLAGHDNASDTIVLTDLGCEGSASAVVHTLGPITVTPAAVEVPPGGAFTFDVTGGSGVLAFEVLPRGAGGTVDAAGRYVAPAVEGEDSVVVTDTRTGEVVYVTVEVTTEAAPDVVPAAAFVPIGSALAPALTGGSGRYDLAVTGDLPFTDGAWAAPAPGASTLVATDHYTGLATTARAFALTALAHDVTTSAPPAFTPTAVTGDLDGDAHLDLVVAVPEATRDRGASGALFVYAGAPEGVDPAPRQILSGATRSELFGRALALADLDDDGRLDLLVGAAAADAPGLGDRGQVALHLGLGDGTFASSAARTWGGGRAGDNLGTAIAVCDFDGDGHLDLAFGAPTGEDPTRTPVVSAHGLVELRLAAGSALADLPDAPTTVRYGYVPGATPTPLENYRLGAALAAGDLDGDGLCDLAVAAIDADNDGAVHVYRGVADGGLSLDPVRAWTGEAPGVSGSRLGQALAIGDLDGDGADDLLMSQRVWSTVPSANNQFGAARLALGGDWLATAEASYRAPTDVDWSTFGDASADQLGAAVALVDATGDGRLDVVVGIANDELGPAPNPTNAGSLAVYATPPANSGDLPAPTWTRRVGGPAANDRCGWAAAVLPRGADAPSDLVALCAGTDTAGPDVGGPVLYRRDVDLEAATPLATPVAPAPWRVGHAVARVPDLDGDGLDELAVGAPDEILVGATGTHQSFAGAVQLHRGAPGGFEAAPWSRVRGFTGHSAADRVGQGLAVGDVDGDGASDLIVVARNEDRPATFAAATYTTTDCAGLGAATDPGAVYVFGRAGGAFTAAPTHVFFGPQASQVLERALAIDIDGDGRDDVVAASPTLDATGRTNTGGFVVHLGRPATAGRITAACAPAHAWLGRGAGDLAGSALAALGDVDRDGCQDFAIGSPLDDLAATDAGVVYLVLGGGPTCAAPTLRAAALTGPSANDGVGESLDAADVDGDGARELLVGSTRHRRNNQAVGAVWLVPGFALEALAREATPLVDGAAPDARAPIVAAADTMRLRVEGAVVGERFGASAALVPSLGPERHAAIVVASPAGARAGPAGVSTFTLHELRFGTFEPLTIMPTPIAVLAGESATPAVMGVASIAALTQGDIGVVALGVADSNAHARDLGAVYVTRVDVVEPLLPPVPPRGPPPCDPPLALAPDELWLVPGEGATLVASGGTGEYELELVEGPSGGAIDPGTGAYVAGGATGVDRVTLTHRRCEGSASALVHVVSPVAIAPAALEVRPGGGFTAAVSGGSGEYTFGLEPSASGASVDDAGRYTAGALEGLDVLTVTDARTGASASTAITVSASAGPHLGPAVVYVPVSHGFVAPPTGGSGEHDASASGDLPWVDGAWQVDAAGAGQVTVTDRWTGAADRQEAHALLALDHTIFLSASAAFTPSIAVGDLDDDALLDAVVALPEATLERSASGALWVYRGTPAGLDPDPVDTLSGAAQSDQLGRGLALHDVDGDGAVDLIVGVPRADTPTLTDSGAVHAHRGGGDGTFDPAPLATWRGLRASDLFGTQVAVCDVDADGAADLIVGAPTAEDTAVTPSASAQGGLFVYRGGPATAYGGWPATASAVRWGQAPVDGVWTSTANLQLGTLVATGDLDGDGACDVVTASQVALGNAGAVWIYRGVPATTGPELLSAAPVRAWSGEDAGSPSGRLGSALAVGDVDGDGDDDVLVGQRTWSTVAGAANSYGAARLALGGAWLATPETAWRGATDFAWSVVGTATGDQLGYAVAIGDATGDAVADVIVGALVDEVAGGASNAGVVTVYPGATYATPATTPARTITSPGVNDRIGVALASLSRVGAPGTAVLAMSQLSDDDGADVGGAHVLTLSGVEARVDLTLPVAPGPWRIGHALAALPDLDGDGLGELAVGAPDEQVLAPSGPDHRSFAGVVHLHRGAPPDASGGFAPAAFQRLGGFAGHSAADRLGNDVAPLGDFDGDGRGDLAVVARFEDRPSSWSTATYTPAADCVAGALSNDGAVYVFGGDGAGGYVPTPTSVFYGPQAEQALDRVIGPGDVDGDGLADLVVSSDLWDDTGKANAGGFQVWTGRAATASRITVGCAPALTWLGRGASDAAGQALAPLGDLDEDGCADFAVGAPLEASNDRGAVYLVLGAGAACASTTFRVTALTGPAANDGIGQALDAADLDGDGRVELAVGSTRHRVANVARGAVWLVEGSRLAELAALAAPVGEAEATATLVLAGDVARLRLEGGVANERFGVPLALIPAVGPSGRAAIAVGSGAGMRAGVPGVSTIVLFPIATPTLAAPDAPLALDPVAVAVLAGETRYPDVLGVGDLAFALQGEIGALAIGLEESNVHARDVGGVYVAPLGPVDRALTEAP